MFIISIILARVSFTQIALGTLYVSLVLIILFLIYKKILSRINREEPNKKLYCELIYLEDDFAKGMVELYFSNVEQKKIQFEILNKDYQSIIVLADQEYAPGQHIVRFDSTSIPNGTYFYQLKTDNQQTMRKMEVHN